ncbi:MAG: DUF4350 domain-containing protein [Chlamydiota bacterium]
MQLALDSGDRKLLIGAAAIVLLLALMAALVGTEGPRPSGYPSSYSAASDGAKAAFLTLQDLGYTTERWLDPPQRLQRQDSLLILADPIVSPSKDERQALRKYVESGGKILATGLSADKVLPEAAAGMNDITSVEWKDFPALVPGALTQGAGNITLVPLAKWTGTGARYIPIYGTAREPVAVVYQLGRGEILWLAASTPLTNAGIQRSGNLELLLNFAGSPGRTRVYWDEYFHGQGRSLADYFGRTPLPWGLAQLGLLLALALLAFSRRSGPVHASVPESRLSSLEFIDTLGGLYQRAHAARGAVEVAYQRFRFLLAKRLGMPLTASDADLEKAARQRLAPPQGLGDTLRRCQGAQDDLDLQDGKALELVQTLHNFSEVLSLQKVGERAWRK